MSGFSEVGVVERALDTASTLEREGEGEASLESGGGSLLGGFVAYHRATRCVVYLGRRSQYAGGVLRGVKVRRHRCGSRDDHLGAGSMFESSLCICQAMSGSVWVSL
jgi:hypothetical protein